MPVERRKLSFASLDDVVRDAESLLAKGYDKAGNWDLAQVCSHLAEWLRFPLDGFPKVPLLLRPLAWLMRATAGKRLRAKVLAEGFGAGGRTIPQTVFGPGGDAAAAVAKLKEVAERFKAHAGPVHPSPLFGAMTKDEALRLQLEHCEHHLGFLIPALPRGEQWFPPRTRSARSCRSSVPPSTWSSRRATCPPSTMR